MVVGLVGEVFKFPPRSTIQQRLVESNTFTFQFRVVEVFKALALDRLQQLRPRTRLVLRMRFLQGFSRRPKKSAKLGPHSGSELGADFAPSTPAAHEDSDGPPMWCDEDVNHLLAGGPLLASTAQPLEGGSDGSGSSCGTNA